MLNLKDLVGKSQALGGMPRPLLCRLTIGVAEPKITIMINLGFEGGPRIFAAYGLPEVVG